ncbi:MAG: NAD-dependent protein deacylase [Firmicutes bacterium]|nr:NAD-dependent protein deacylase [Bacillota bacterium]
MKKVVAFTGAGISVASGLPTFDFTWRGIPARDLLTIESFLADPERFYLFFREALARWQAATPNPAHRALAAAEIPVITQNIDGLHQRAGSRVVVELHGNLRHMVCLGCGHREPLVLPPTGLPLCRCGRVLKPDVVLFGEELHGWEEAIALLEGVEHLLVIGTSLTVAPACYIPGYAAASGATVEIINEAAATKVPEAVARLRREGAIAPARSALRS